MIQFLKYISKMNLKIKRTFQILNVIELYIALFKDCLKIIYTI